MKQYRKSLTAICTALCLLAAPASTGLLSHAAHAKNPDTAPATFANLAEKLLPTVVNISSTQKVENKDSMSPLPNFPKGSPFENFFEEFYNFKGQQNQQEAPTSLGSGFVLDANKGYIVTNNHVIQGAETVSVTLQDETTLTAEIIGRDEKTDLAVLKVDASKTKLTATKFGNSKVMRVGDWIVAIGNPFGLGGTVTAGIISARQRNINAGPYDDFLQTDASINRGNSGGPMFNLDGEVIGINTAIYSPSGGSVGIGFAIPSNLANPVIDQLIKYGRTRRGWLGVRIQSVTGEIAESLGLKDNDGALVASVNPGSPAEKADLQPGDVIIEFNGERISKMRNLPRIVAETPIGESVKMKVWRDGQEIDADVEIGELEKAEDEGLLDSAPYRPNDDQGVDVDEVGLTLNNINDTHRESYGYDENVTGVVITAVSSGSEADKKDLAEGDVIVEIYQQPATDASTVADIITKARDADRNSVLLLVNHGGSGDVRFVALKLRK